MQQISEFLSHAAFTLMAMCAFILLPRYFATAQNSKNHSILLFAILMLCGCGYLMTECFGPFTNMSFLWWLEYMSLNALPGLFWLTAVCIFSEKHMLKKWHYALALSTLFIPLSATLLQLIFGFDLKEFPALWGLVTYGAMFLELTLIVYTFIIAAKNWQSDLVQDRRYMRGSVISFAAMYIVLVIASEQIFLIEWLWLDVVKFSLLVLLMGTINFVLFSLKDGALFGVHPVTVAPPVKPNKAESLELQRIIDCMLNEKFYRNEGVTITLLSKHLSIQEYKLRQLINGELAYRNFNDFLNFYRIQDVTKMLSDPNNAHVPVLTLALDSGFRSLSSFNKAFKATHGLTPTEFRNRI